MVETGGHGWVNDPNGRDFAFFDALYSSLLTRFCVDTGHVFSFGSSMGAGFNNVLGCYRGDRLRAIGSLMGAGPGDGCTASTSALIYHNQDDPTVPYASGVASRDYWVNVNGCNSATRVDSPSTCSEYYQCNPGRSVEWCSQPAGGHTSHTWAVDTVWRFFQRHF